MKTPTSVPTELETPPKSLKSPPYLFRRSCDGASCTQGHGIVFLSRITASPSKRNGSMVKKRTTVSSSVPDDNESYSTKSLPHNHTRTPLKKSKLRKARRSLNLRDDVRLVRGTDTSKTSSGMESPFIRDVTGNDQITSDYSSGSDTPSKLKESTERLSWNRSFNKYIAYGSDDELTDWWDKPKTEYTYWVSDTYRDNATPDRFVPSPNMSRRSLSSSSSVRTQSITKKRQLPTLAISTPDSISLRTRSVYRRISQFSDDSDNESFEVQNRFVNKSSSVYTTMDMGFDTDGAVNPDDSPKSKFARPVVKRKTVRQLGFDSLKSATKNQNGLSTSDHQMQFDHSNAKSHLRIASKLAETCKYVLFSIYSCLTRLNAIFISTFTSLALFASHLLAKVSPSKRLPSLISRSSTNYSKAKSTISSAFSHVRTSVYRLVWDDGRPTTEAYSRRTSSKCSRRILLLIPLIVAVPLLVYLWGSSLDTRYAASVIDGDSPEQQLTESSWYSSPLYLMVGSAQSGVEIAGRASGLAWNWVIDAPRRCLDFLYDPLKTAPFSVLVSVSEGFCEPVLRFGGRAVDWLSWLLSSVISGVSAILSSLASWIGLAISSLFSLAGFLVTAIVDVVLYPPTYLWSALNTSNEYKSAKPVREEATLSARDSAVSVDEVVGVILSNPQFERLVLERLAKVRDGIETDIAARISLNVKSEIRRMQPKFSCCSCSNTITKRIDALEMQQNMFQDSMDKTDYDGVIERTERVREAVAELKRNVTKYQDETRSALKAAQTAALDSEIRWREARHSNVSATSTVCSCSNETRVLEMIRKALSTYDADKTGLADHALESAGGSVVSTRCTEDYEGHLQQLYILGIPINQFSSNTPRSILQPSRLPGDCYAFKGTQGYIVIRLTGPVRVTGVSVEHIPKSISTTGKIDSAPKGFSVYGLHEVSKEEGFFFGNFTYRDGAEPLQYFPVATSPDFFPFVELKINSNHGNMDYTCIYRFRVHGVRKH